MKKTTNTFLISGLLFITGLKAQTIQEGMNHLYADRFKSAVAVFEKLLATNPNNMDATYWLGQTYFDMDDNAAARQLYEKALMTNGNAPLILVGLGHADLLDNKTSDARQRFEAAITASRGKKGDDPAVLTAIGRANVDAKAGDFNYAIEKLKVAVLRDPLNTETWLQLGNAYRKAKPGEGGGDAYQSYKKTLEINPAFAVADLRLAKIFVTQRNWELVLQYLNEAITRDPKFTPAYYELFFYYFFQRQDFNEAENQLKKYIDSKLPETDIQDEYLYGQLCWAHKDFDCAIDKAQKVVSAEREHTKPKLYKLLAYAWSDKGDSLLALKDSMNTQRNYNEAKKFIDQYFEKERPEDIILKDIELKAKILSRTSSSPDEIYDTYIKGAAMDTVLQSKIDFLKKGAECFKAMGDSISRNKEGDLRMEIIRLRANPGQRDYFDAGFAYYQGKNYTRSDSLFTIYTEKYPDENFGWQWRFNIQRALDTSMEKGLAVQPAIKYLEILERDTAKYKPAILSTAGYLAQYYANILKDKVKAVEYLKIMLVLDPTNETIIKYITDLEKPPVPKQTTNPKTKTPAKTTATKKATTVKPKTKAVVKNTSVKN